MYPIVSCFQTNYCHLQPYKKGVNEGSEALECQGTVRAPEIKKNNNLKIRGQRENGVWGEKCGDKAKGMECKVREGKVSERLAAQ